MRTSEFFMALPWLYLLLGVRAILPLHVGGVQAFCLVIGIIGAVGWVRPARLIRGVVLSAREEGFVLAARGFGADSALHNSPARGPAHLGGPSDPGYGPDSTIHSGRGDALVSRLGGRRTDAELGQYACGGPPVPCADFAPVASASRVGRCSGPIRVPRFGRYIAGANRLTGTVAVAGSKVPARLTTFVNIAAYG